MNVKTMFQPKPETALPQVQGEVSQKPFLCEVCKTFFGKLVYDSRQRLWACQVCHGQCQMGL